MILKENKILLIIFIIYLLLTLFVGAHHEPWFDEAQAWLIARDNSYFDIIKALSNEGHPFNWYYIIKTFQLCGLSYDYFYLISIFFSAIGVYLFLFKTDFPLLIKGLVPFSYPLFYQYAIVSRSYCLIFPTLMLYSCLYRKYRYSNPFLIIFMLIILAGISLHMVVLSFVLLVLYVLDLVQNKQFALKARLSILFLFAFYGFTYWYLGIGGRNPYQEVLNSSLSSFFYNYCHSVKSLLFADNGPVILGTIFVVILMCILFYSFFKSIYKTVLLVLGTLGFYLYFSIIKMNPWHTDMFLVFCIFLFSFYFKDEYKSILKNKLFYSLFGLILVISVFYSFSTSCYDIKHKYDSAKQVAKILRGSSYLNKKIFSSDFKTFALQPYFEKNIFVNSEKSWWIWDDSTAPMDFSSIEVHNPDIILVSTHKENQVVYDLLEQNNIQYKKMCLNSSMYYKYYKYENNGYCMLLLNE